MSDRLVTPGIAKPSPGAILGSRSQTFFVSRSGQLLTPRENARLRIPALDVLGIGGTTRVVETTGIRIPLGVAKGGQPTVTGLKPVTPFPKAPGPAPFGAPGAAKPLRVGSTLRAADAVLAQLPPSSVGGNAMAGSNAAVDFMTDFMEALHSGQPGRLAAFFADAEARGLILPRGTTPPPSQPMFFQGYSQSFYSGLGPEAVIAALRTAGAVIQAVGTATRYVIAARGGGAGPAIRRDIGAALRYAPRALPFALLQVGSEPPPLSSAARRGSAPGRFQVDFAAESASQIAQEADAPGLGRSRLPAEARPYYDAVIAALRTLPLPAGIAALSAREEASNSLAVLTPTQRSQFVAQLQTPKPAGGVGPGEIVILSRPQPDIRLPGLPPVREILGLQQVQLQISDAIQTQNRSKLGGGPSIALPDFSTPPGTSRSDP